MIWNIILLKENVLKRIIFFILFFVNLILLFNCKNKTDKLAGTWLETTDESVEVMVLSEDGRLHTEIYYIDGTVYNGPFDGSWEADDKNLTKHIDKNDFSRTYSWELSDDNNYLTISYDVTNTVNTYKRIPDIQTNIKDYLFSAGILKHKEIVKEEVKVIFFPEDFKSDLKGLNLIGWSKNGKIAYQYDWDSYGRPSNGTVFIIADLIEDKEVVKFMTEEYSCETDSEKAAMIKANEDAVRNFNESLSEYGIDSNQPAVENFPVSGVNCFLKIFYSKTDISGTMVGDIFKWDYLLIAEKNNSEKVVTSGTDSAVMMKKVAGYCKSPYENRIAVIVDTFYWGLENECYHSYGIYGCHLDSGF